MSEINLPIDEIAEMLKKQEQKIKEEEFIRQAIFDTFLKKAKELFSVYSINESFFKKMNEDEDIRDFILDHIKKDFFKNKEGFIYEKMTRTIDDSCFILYFYHEKSETSFILKIPMYHNLNKDNFYYTEGKYSFTVKNGMTYGGKYGAFHSSYHISEIATYIENYFKEEN